MVQLVQPVLIGHIAACSIPSKQQTSIQKTLYNQVHSPQVPADSIGMVAWLLILVEYWL